MGRDELPHTHGVQVRVVGAAVAAATVRSVLECPIEFAKVARQTGQDWKLNQVYRYEGGVREEGRVRGREDGREGKGCHELIFRSPTCYFPPIPSSLPLNEPSFPPSLLSPRLHRRDRGIGLQLGRTGGVMTTYFVTVDSIR